MVVTVWTSFLWFFDVYEVRFLDHPKDAVKYQRGRKVLSFLYIFLTMFFTCNSELSGGSIPPLPPKSLCGGIRLNGISCKQPERVSRRAPWAKACERRYALLCKKSLPQVPNTESWTTIRWIQLVVTSANTSLLADIMTAKSVRVRTMLIILLMILLQGI